MVGACKYCGSINSNCCAESRAQNRIDALEASERRLQEIAEDAMHSLFTIATQAGKEDGLIDMTDVRGYARNRAKCAQDALTTAGIEV